MVAELGDAAGLLAEVQAAQHPAELIKDVARPLAVNTLRNHLGKWGLFVRYVRTRGLAVSDATQPGFLAYMLKEMREDGVGHSVPRAFQTAVSWTCRKAKLTANFGRAEVVMAQVALAEQARKS